MAVYEHSYRAFEGQLTRTWSRFLVPARYAFRDVFASRLFLVFYVLCFIVPLGFGALIYVSHNLSLVEILRTMDMENLSGLKISARVFRAFLAPQGGFAFVLALIVGPALVSPDLRNNALPLYLYRPFSKAEYVLGKMAVVAILLSSITWVPGLLLFALQAYLEGGGWWFENFRLAVGLFVGSWVWILVLTLMTLATSAVVKRKLLARILFLGAYFIFRSLGQIINGLYETWRGSLLILDDLRNAVWDQLLGVRMGLSLNEAMGLEPIPPGPAWLVLVLLSAFCLVLLLRRVRAYEVVT